jgi:hypothetical protein
MTAAEPTAFLAERAVQHRKDHADRRWWLDRRVVVERHDEATATPGRSVSNGHSAGTSVEAGLELPPRKGKRSGDPKAKIRRQWY